jgi:hypothetical protein
MCVLLHIAWQYNERRAAVGLRRAGQALRCPRKCGTLLPGTEMLPLLPGPVALVNSFCRVNSSKSTKI